MRLKVTPRKAREELNQGEKVGLEISRVVIRQSIHYNLFES